MWEWALRIVLTLEGIALCSFAVLGTAGGWAAVAGVLLLLCGLVSLVVRHEKRERNNSDPTRKGK